MTQLALMRGENFRLFERLEFTPHPGFNLVTGENAAGKTSLLESIYCLGRAKSFRGSSLAELAGQGGRHWRVAGKLQKAAAPALSAAVRWDTQGTGIQLGGSSGIGTIELVRSIPMQVIEPAMHRLLQDGPGYRRSFLDWGVFHVEHQFFPIWRRHQRALRQRNRALKQKAAPREITVWNPELAEAAERLHALRAAHLLALKPQMDAYVSRLFDAEEWSAELHAGWPSEVSYAKILHAHLERDRRMGTTVEGAHRAELRVKLNHHQVKNRISRGQQKLLIAALVLAQSKLIHRQTGNAPILLVDDFAAELAGEYQKALLGMLREYPGQVFLSAFARDPVFDTIADFSMFHVEHGRVRQC
ncbi:MAG: DNA replication/repair protein RecF [Stenotrophobium sp.]